MGIVVLENCFYSWLDDPSFHGEKLENFMRFHHSGHRSFSLKNLTIEFFLTALNACIDKTTFG